MIVERMIELLEIEKECVLRNASGECNRYCPGCDLLQDDTELHEMYTEAIALLKTQEPRVMTLKEVQLSCNALTLEKRHTVCYGLETVLLVAQLDYAEPPCEKFGVSGYEETQAFNDCDYGKTWRCWTSRPTDAQRDATPWE